MPSEETRLTDAEEVLDLHDIGNPLLMNEVVVTATRSERSLDEVPYAVNVFNDQDIERRIDTSMAGLFDGRAGLATSSTGPGSVRPVIRGLTDERVLILVNGQRLSELRPGGNHILSLDPAQIRRVEIIRGPSSILYGSDAIGGVYNIMTKKAPLVSGEENRFEGEVFASYESGNQGFSQGGYTEFGKGNWNGYVGGVYRTTDDIETDSGDLRFSGYNGGTFWLGGNYVADNWSNELGYSYMEADIGIPTGTAFLEDEFKDERHHQLTGRFLLEDITEYWTQLELSYGWQLHERNRVRRPSGRLVNIKVDINTLTFEPIATLNLFEKHETKIGLPFFFEDAESSRDILRFPAGSTPASYAGVPVIPQSNRYGVGGFIQHEYTPTDRLTLLGGLRFDSVLTTAEATSGHFVSDDKTKHDFALTGNLGASYQLTDPLSIYANAGRAFRSPTLLERFFDGPHDGPGIDQGDPGLDSEGSWNFDIGTKFEDEKTVVNLSTFYTLIDDYIVKELTNPGTAPAGRIYQWGNTGEAVLHGFEAEFTRKLDYGFSIYGAMTYIDGRDLDSADELPGIPPLQGTYGLRWEETLFDHYDTYAEFEGRTWAKQDDPSALTGEIDTYESTIFTLRTGTTIYEHLTVNFVIENLFDRNYHDHLSRVWQDFEADHQPGRNYKVSMKYTF